MNLSAARKTAAALVAQMTAEEKIAQLQYQAEAIPRLGIHEYNWWNEACHGVARAGVATVFPQTIGLAATFHPALVGAVAGAIGDEARAKYNASVAYGDRGIYKGLTYWSPNINIFRDPRWGRGQETFGEDPYLTATLGCAYITGLQGEGDFYKAAACAKHFAVHSGPEKLRHSFNAEVSQKDLFETYLPAFEQAVKKAGVAGVMGAYNRTNGKPCCASEPLIAAILREQWQFKGYFVSDCGAIADIAGPHGYAEDLPHAAAAALRAGCDLNCGEAYAHLTEAYEADLITDDDLTRAAERLFTIRALLGEFEQPRPYADIPYQTLCCKAHKGLNLQAAQQSLVLLKNEADFLPLDPAKAGSVAVIGPHALSTLPLEGNYYGHADEYIPLAEGMRRVFGASEILVADGCQADSDPRHREEGFTDLESEAMAAAAHAEVTLLCLGLNRHLEGEDTGDETDYSDHGDRKTLLLPAPQRKLAEALCDVCENLIVVTLAGSGVDLGEKVRRHAKAIVHGWYPGALGGLAVAGLLAGQFSPSGRLPITFYRADSPLPPMTNYAMAGRTYRYLTEEPLYPFGYGLSYAKFHYSEFQILRRSEEEIAVAVTVQNTGDMPARETVQLYARYTDSRTTTPHFQLCALAPVTLQPGEARRVEAAIDRYWLKAVLADGRRVNPNGGITLFAGGHAPDKTSERLLHSHCLTAEV